LRKPKQANLSELLCGQLSSSTTHVISIPIPRAIAIPISCTFAVPIPISCSIANPIPVFRAIAIIFCIAFTKGKYFWMAIHLFIDDGNSRHISYTWVNYPRHKGVLESGSNVPS